MSLSQILMKSGASRIHILVVNCNQIAHTKTCVEDLRAQTVPFRLTIVDQGSTEQGTAEFLAEAEAKEYEVIRNEENLSLHVVWNRFAAMGTEEEFLCFLNNDVRIPANFLDHTIRCFEADSKVGCALHPTNRPDFREASPDFHYVIHQPICKQGWDFSLRREAWVPIPGELEFYCGDDYLFEKLRENEWKTAFALNSPMVHLKGRTNPDKYRAQCDADIARYIAMGFEHNVPHCHVYSHLYPEFETVTEAELPEAVPTAERRSRPKLISLEAAPSLVSSRLDASLIRAEGWSTWAPVYLRLHDSLRPRVTVHIGLDAGSALACKPDSPGLIFHSVSLSHTNEALNQQFYDWKQRVQESGREVQWLFESPLARFEPRSVDLLHLSCATPEELDPAELEPWLDHLTDAGALLITCHQPSDHIDWSDFETNARFIQFRGKQALLFGPAALHDLTESPLLHTLGRNSETSARLQRLDVAHAATLEKLKEEEGFHEHYEDALAALEKIRQEVADRKGKVAEQKKTIQDLKEELRSSRQIQISSTRKKWWKPGTKPH